LHNPEEKAMSEATTLQSIRGGFIRMASGMAALVMAIALSGCFQTVPTCPSGQVPVVSTATYAVYVTAADKYQVENVKELKSRCFVPVTEKPAGSGSTSQAANCATGTSPLVTGTVWGTYYDGKDVGKQAEDTKTVNERCIVELPPEGGSACDPGFHPVVRGGKVYCVPN
jgi:hypothetical protein